MAKKRNKVARIVLTSQAYKAIEDAAFKNCRTVSQELSYRIERQIEGKPVSVAPAVRLDRYDDAPTVEAAPVAPVESVKPLPPAGWTKEQEDAINVLGAGLGKTEAEITMLRLIHKDYNSVKAAIEAEAVPA